MRRPRRIMVLGIVFVAGLILPHPHALADSRGVRVDGKPPAEYVAGHLGKAWAVVIGIDRYQKIPPLQFAVADAKAVAQTLRRQGYEVTELYNDRATRRTIEHELRTTLPRKVGLHDRVLIFYAGHGQDDKVAGGKPLGYLLPVDGERDDVPATGISMGTVRELADALPAKHVLFLLDVCFGGIAGTLKRGPLPEVTEVYLKQITRERGRQLITAGAADQEVLESAQWGHSVFTYFLLKGLNEGLADQDDNGVITAEELHVYLESRVLGEALQQGQTQTPQIAELSGEKGQFVFLTTLSVPPPSAFEGEKQQAAYAARLEEDWATVQSIAAQKGMKAAKRLAALDKFLQVYADDNPHVGEVEALKQRIHAELQVASVPSYSTPKEAGREIEGRDGAKMLLIPAGEFMMGSTDGDPDEKPVHRVSLDAFYLDKYEVTTNRYAKFMQDTGRKQPEQPEYWNQVSQVSAGDRPVIGVDWYDADAYCRYYGKRLPTEAEWEKAARGTDGRKYPWGNYDPSSGMANYGKEWESGINYYSERLTPVGSYEDGKSPYGIYDLAGNVWEWVADWYDEGYYQRSPERNPTGPSNSDRKGLRGGSWLLGPADVRSALRYGDRPMYRNALYGFRCAQDTR